VNLRQLRYFIAVAEAGSITRAAEAVLVAQPSLSQQIRVLEAELGGALLERMPGGVRLTAAGRAFLPEARAAVERADRAAHAARAALGARGGELELVTLTSLAVGLLPAVLRAFHERFPEVAVRLREHSHRGEMEERVRDGLGDLAIGPPPPSWPWPVEPLGWEEMVVVLPPSDPLAARGGRVDLAELADREWVLFETGHGLHDLMTLVCADAGFVPRGTVRTSQVVAAPLLAAAGLGPALVPDNVVPPGLEAEVRGLRPPRARRVTVYGRGAPAPLAAAFLGVLRALPWRTRRPAGAVPVAGGDL
jgi:DNA-binding transcriptional LysR family regulator